MAAGLLPDNSYNQFRDLHTPIIVDNSAYHDISISYDTPDSDYDSNNHSDSDPPDFNFQSLTVLYTNADQFLNKRDELQMFITGNEPDIILISEVLPKSHCNSVSSSRLSLNGYNMFFNFDPDGCRPNTNIRGVGIYISKRISVSEYYFTQAPTFGITSGFQCLLKVVIVY